MTEFRHITQKCELFPSGNIKTVCIEINGKIEGECIHFYQNGHKYIILNYNNGIRNGKCTEYYANGIIKSVSNYVNDELLKEDDNDTSDEIIKNKYCVIC
jgi:antitoxin component YwqK of YwqJK toxin-antitoxin module